MYIVYNYFILIIYIIILYLNELEYRLVKLNELKLVKGLVKLNESSPNFKK